MSISEEEEKKIVSGFMSLAKRTNKQNPKPEDLAELKKTFDAVPWLALKNGDVQAKTLEAIAKTGTGDSVFGAEAVTRYVRHLKDELGFQKSSFIEKMLISEVAMRWLRLNILEKLLFEKIQAGHSIKEGEYYDKLLDASQKRYLRAIETLAKVRRMIARTQADGARMFKDLLTTGESKHDKKDT